MQLAPIEVDTFSRGSLKSVEYRVSPSAHLMELLSSGIYSDEISAVVRELGTNTCDAHILAGTTHLKPKLSLPTPENPEFRLRDFGTGMSPERVETVYTEYGNSEKTNSNLLNGCMGIGSKSPFCYVPSFTTISYYNGMKYLYVNAKDKNGKPTINLFHSEPTDEPNGMEVYFACKPEDCREFKNKAQKILQWFPIEFEVTCADGEFTLPVHSYSYEGHNWKLRKDSNDPIVVMGGVAYPIESKHFSIIDKTRSTDWYRHYDDSPIVKLLQLGLELHVEMGAVQFSVSREHLKYTDDTIDFIKRTVEDVLVELQLTIEQEIYNAKSYWEACMIYKRLFSMGGQFYNLASLFKPRDIKWNGRELQSEITVKHSELTTLGLSVMKNDYYKNGKSKRQDDICSIDVNDNAKFMAADMERGNYVAVNNLAEDKGLRSDGGIIYLIKINRLLTTTDKAVDGFVDLFGIPKDRIILCSDIPKKVRSKTAVKRVNVFTLNLEAYRNRRGSGERDYWKETSVDFNAGGVFLEINGWHAHLNGDYVSTNKIYSIIDGLKLLNVTVPTIVGVKSLMVHKYQKAGNWTDFGTWAREQLSKAITNDIRDAITIHKSHADTSNNSTYHKLVRIVEQSGGIFEKSDSLAKELLDKVGTLIKMKKEAVMKLDDTETLLESMRLVKFTLPPDSNISDPEDLNALTDSVDKKYVLLNHFSIWECDKTTSPAMLEYINLIDAKP